MLATSRPHTRILAAFTAVLLFGGCEKAPTPGIVRNEQKPSPAVATAADSVSATPNREESIEAEVAGKLKRKFGITIDSTRGTTSVEAKDGTALVEAKACFASHFLQRGDSWVGRYPYDGGYFIEYSKPIFEIVPSNSEADRLNGFEYRGTLHVTSAAQRRALGGDPKRLNWGSWEDARPREFEITKRNGVWTCAGFESGGKPRLADLPN